MPCITIGVFPISICSHQVFFLYIKTSFIFWNTILEETMRRSGQIPGIYTITARAQHFLNEAILYSLSQNWFFFIIDALSYTIKTFSLSPFIKKKIPPQIYNFFPSLF